MNDARIGRARGPTAGRYVTVILRGWVPDHPAEAPYVEVTQTRTGRRRVFRDWEALVAWLRQELRPPTG